MNGGELMKRIAFAKQAYTGGGENEGSGGWPDAGQEVCIANIGPNERSRRLTFGLVAMGAGAALAAVLIAFHVNPLFRLVVFIPFASGASGYFQARDKT